MVKKTMQLGQFRNFCIAFLTEWNREKDNIKVSGKGIYGLIRFKKIIESKLTEIEESFLQTCRNHGGEQREDGSIFIPEDKREECNADLETITREEVELQYSPIKLTENDDLGLTLLDILFEFVDFSEIDPTEETIVE